MEQERLISPVSNKLVAPLIDSLIGFGSFAFTRQNVFSLRSKARSTPALRLCTFTIAPGNDRQIATADNQCAQRLWQLKRINRANACKISRAAGWRSFGADRITSEYLSASIFVRGRFLLLLVCVSCVCFLCFVCVLFQSETLPFNLFPSSPTPQEQIAKVSEQNKAHPPLTQNTPNTHTNKRHSVTEDGLAAREGKRSSGRFISAHRGFAERRAVGRGQSFLFTTACC